VKQEVCDEVQFRVKDNPTEKREKEGKKQTSEAREVLIERIYGVLHVLLYDLEKLCLNEFLKEMFRCLLSKEKEKQKDHDEQQGKDQHI